MKLLSTEIEREKLLKRLRSAPKTREVESAIRIVEEAIEYAQLRDIITNVFNTPYCPGTIEKIVESSWMPHEMRLLSTAIEKIYLNVKEQRFKNFYGLSGKVQDEPEDDDDWVQI